MKASKRILLYGNSVILGTIGASLRRCPQFEVTTVLQPSQTAKGLDASKPGILLFDLKTTHPEVVFPLLETNPNLQLIGVSPGINLVKVWSIRELREISMQELLQVIKREAKDSPVDQAAIKFDLVEAQQTNDQRKGR